MSQDDDATIERVARAMVTADNGDPEQIIYRRTGPDSFEPLGSAWELLKPNARAALSAYLSALPERELLAEALEALQVFETMAHTYDCDDDEEGKPEVPDKRRLRIEETNGDLSLSIVDVGDFRRARAAADKIRDALEHQQQQKGEEL